MEPARRVLSALALSVAAAFAAPQAAAQAVSFSNVYVFGDSLSDSGYYRPVLLASGLPASVVNVLGRFTTNPGPIWAEIIAAYYGSNAAPSNAGGNIFAQGGARVALPSASTPTGGAQRPVSTQITEYLARNGGTADPNALYTVWAGANDIFQNLGALQAGAIDAAALQANVLAAAAAEVQQIARLQAAGARYIVVFSLPDIGATPQFGASATTAGQVTALSAGYNTTLFSGLASAGVRVIPVDAFSLISEVRANPAAFGFTNVTGVACGPFPGVTTTPNSQFCLPTNYVNTTAAETYLFADGVHPTTGAHRIVAQFVQAMIEGPAVLSMLAEVPLRTRAGHLRTLEDGLATAALGQLGRWQLFVSGDKGNFDIERGTGSAGLGSENESFALGTTVRATEAVTLGAAFGLNRSESSFGGGMGSFETEDRSLSLFGTARSGGLHGTLILTLADIRFDDVRRTFRLGNLDRVASASPDGSNASAHLALGYDFRMGRLSIGPTVSMTHQNVEINAFSEEGGGSSNLRIADQKRRSEVWSAGLRASYDLGGGWTPWVRVTADKERRDDVRFVTATPVSLASGNSYDIPGYVSDTSFMTAAVGIRGQVTPGIGLSAAYYRVSGRSGIEEDGITGMVSIRF
jgi:outer membrane lipase/esterase